mgnify:CR=1 FL=1
MRATGSSTYPTEFDVLNYPHPVLRGRAEPVTEFDDELRRFCERMFSCMDEHHGVGLAAPQVGVSKRIFITDHARKQGDQFSDRRIWINPRLENGAGETVYEEGCLSFPGIYAKVQRYNRVDVVYQDVFGFEQRMTFDVAAGDFLGIVTQHELDHLDGKVFVDHLTPAQLTLVRRALRELEDDYKHATGKAGAILRR